MKLLCSESLDLLGGAISSFADQNEAASFENLPDSLLQPAYFCARCPRLSAFLQAIRQQHPDWYNQPVPPFLPKAEGGENVLSKIQLLIVGLAPGLRGANRTGRPFTGDYAGELLYATLCQYGFAQGTFQAHPQDGLVLHETAIVNAVRCVPPENKPLGHEINQCRDFLASFVAHLPRLRLIIALGAIAHKSVIQVLGGKISHYPFRHGQLYSLGSHHILSSYHCSRYNTSTKLLTPEMFQSIFAQARDFLQ